MAAIASTAGAAGLQQAPLVDNEMYHNLQVIPENELQAEDDFCQICLDPLRDNGPILGHIAMSHNLIKHVFHKNCIEKVLRMKADCATCPYCGIHIHLPAEAPKSTMTSMGTMATLTAGVGAFALELATSFLFPVSDAAAGDRYYNWF